MAEQGGRVLHLIDDQRLRMARQEGLRIPLGLRRLAGQIEAHVAVIREEMAAEGGHIEQSAAVADPRQG
ncbi:MAG: hypothetical protein VKN15_02190 [Cyanobacteriota bacterium]|nr:hypothetical protein [Cyanobacteriota bacterium]